MSKNTRRNAVKFLRVFHRNATYYFVPNYFMLTDSFRLVNVGHSEDHGMMRGDEISPGPPHQSLQYQLVGSGQFRGTSEEWNTISSAPGVKQSVDSTAQPISGANGRGALHQTFRKGRYRQIAGQVGQSSNVVSRDSEIRRIVR